MQENRKLIEEAQAIDDKKTNEANDRKMKEQAIEE